MSPPAQDRPAPQRLAALVERFAGRRVVVIGDLCLDEYIVGRAHRLSREAPVPVLQWERRFSLPGAAANPALNIAGLGGEAIMVGLVGDDEAGAELRRRLSERGIDVDGVLVDPGRTTTVKTRVLAESSLRFPQQVVRVDRTDTRPPPPAIEAALATHIRLAVPQADALLVSDYKNGVVCPRVITAAQEAARSSGRTVTVDSQGDLHLFNGFTVVKANHEDAAVALGQPLTSDDTLAEAGDRLRRELGATALLITRGGDGMSVLAEDMYLHVPAANRSEVFDVTGAGDTVIAVLTLALAAGTNLAEAVYLANHAAGIVVRKLGNATPTPDELRGAILGS